MMSGKESKKNLSGPVGNGVGNGTPLMEHEAAPSFGTEQRKAMNSEDFRGDETTSDPSMGVTDRKKKDSVDFIK